LKVVGVYSGKGGTGKSLVSVNLAYHLKKLSNASVGLLDADVDSSNLASFIGRIGEIKVTEDKKFSLLDWEGIKVWSLSLTTDPERPVSLTGDKYAEILNDVVHHSEWGNPDYMVIDLPSGSADSWRGMVYIFAENLVGDVIVVQPAFPQNARRALNLHTMSDVPVVGLIENMSYFVCPEHQEPKRYYPFGKGMGRELAAEFGVPFLGEIPIIPDLQERLAKGSPIIEHKEPFEAAAKIVMETPQEKVGIIRKVKEKVVEVTRDYAVKVLAFIVQKVGKEIPIPKGFRPEEDRVADVVVTDESRTKVLTRWHLRMKSDGRLVFVKSPPKVDFAVELPFRTLARIVVGKKRLRSGKVIPYDAEAAWLNGDLDLYGEGATTRAFSLIREVLLNESVLEAARSTFGFLEKFI
jgi:ATP-binding protein involved in chromosome partitioning